MRLCCALAQCFLTTTATTLQKLFLWIFFFFFWITKGYLLCCRIRLRVSLLMFDFGNLFVFGFSILVLSLVYYKVVCTSSMLPPAVFIPPPPSGVFGLNMPLSVRPSAHPPVHLCVLPLNICRIYMKLSL